MLHAKLSCLLFQIDWDADESFCLTAHCFIVGYFCVNWCNISNNVCILCIMACVCYYMKIEYNYALCILFAMHNICIISLCIRIYSTHIKKPRLHIQYISFKNLINILLYNYSKILLLHYIATTLLLLL